MLWERKECEQCAIIFPPVPDIWRYRFLLYSAVFSTSQLMRWFCIDRNVHHPTLKGRSGSPTRFNSWNGVISGRVIADGNKSEIHACFILYLFHPIVSTLSAEAKDRDQKSALDSDLTQLIIISAWKCNSPLPPLWRCLHPTCETIQDSH